MLNKKVMIILFAVFGVVALGSTYKNAWASKASFPIMLEVQLSKNVALNSVVFGEDRSITIRGVTSEPSSSCLPISVFVDGERGSWWPVFRCIQVDDSGEWMLRVPSDDGGSPLRIHSQIGR